MADIKRWAKYALLVALWLTFIVLTAASVVRLARAQDAKPETPPVDAKALQDKIDSAFGKKPDPPKTITLSQELLTKIQSLQWRQANLDKKKQSLVDQLLGKEVQQLSADQMAVAREIQEKYKINLNAYTLDLEHGVLTPVPAAPPAAPKPEEKPKEPEKPKSNKKK